MRAKSSSPGTDELFRSRLDQILNMNRPLILLGQTLDWDVFTQRFGALYSEQQGRPGLPIRLMVGLTYLSRTYNLSDEEVVARWLDNPYWQYFCGYEYFQHDIPCDPSSLVRWRQRIKEDGVEFLLQQTINVAKRAKMISKHDLDKVNVDTTVQEKAIRFPTDARLYHRMLEHLVKAARKYSIPLRQSYVRKGKRALLRQSSYGHARQMKRAAGETKKLKTMLGCVYRDILRKVMEPTAELARELELAARLLSQKKQDKNKLYSIHEPDVECISKGKIHKKYEFGNKTGFVTTSSQSWVIGAMAFHGNPYDGHTLAAMLDQVQRLTGWEAKEAYCDLGYRGHGYSGSTTVHVVNLRKRAKKRSEHRWQKRRAAIEPVIGHLKEDHRLNRNQLKGKDGDKLNALLAACGKNLRKWLQIFLPHFLRHAIMVDLAQILEKSVDWLTLKVA